MYVDVIHWLTPHEAEDIWVQTSNSGSVHFRRSPFGRWLSWKSEGGYRGTADEYDPVTNVITTYRYRRYSNDHEAYIETIRQHWGEIRREKPKSKVRNKLVSHRFAALIRTGPDRSRRGVISMERRT